ncbi:MAG: HIT domain-containing protein [Dissulfurispiraceae bacterium]
MSGHLITLALKIARDKETAAKKLRLLTHGNIEGEQSVNHLHFCVFGGRRMLCHQGSQKNATD